jgi:hypothetical protein
LGAQRVPGAEVDQRRHAFGPRDVPHKFKVGPGGGFESVVEEASVPAETRTLPPASVLPPENVAEIVLRHGNELLEG